MKKVDTISVYAFIYFLILSYFTLIGVLSDSTNSNESSLDIQPTILVSNNISTNAEQKAAVSLEESNIVTSSETQSDEVASLVTPTNKLEEVPESLFSEVTQSSGVTNEIINNDTPTVIPHIDSATEELKERAANLVSSLSSQDNLNENVGLEKTNITTPVTKVEDNRSDLNTTTIETDEKLMPKNVTDKNAEDIPSFAEWAQKHLEEVEKKEQANCSTPSQTINTTKQGSGAKLRWKNYASVDCGAKVILANSEAQNTWAILSPSRDEYKLNPCNSRIWFIIELCEAIQVKKIDLANYELFSSSPKDFTVSVSDRFPTRDWSLVGQFTAKDERDVQNFDVNTETFGKYVKVEIKSHYGSEHYCPLSLFRAYGTSVFEVLQKDDPAHEQPIDDDDDDETLDHAPKGDTSGNLLSSATDAVLSMVKNVAGVLGSKVNKTKESSETSNDAQPSTPIIKSCTSPSHYVVCNNCSDMLFGRIFELLSCSQKQINYLVNIPFISRALVNSIICERFGFDFKSEAAKITANSCPKCIDSFFPPQYLGAMCNALAVTLNKVLYNVSHQYANTTENILTDNLVNVENQESKAMPDIKTEPKEILDEALEKQPTEPLFVEYPEINSKTSCSTDLTYASQIKPSRSIATDLPVHSELNTASVNLENPSQHTDNFEQKASENEAVEPTIVETITDTVYTPQPDVVTESTVDENMDKLMTELNSESGPSVTSTPTAASNLQGQKESVFLRLSNRIKALERNMSLSGQYLEELSKRYKKQVEEMQRVLEKTEQTLNDVTSNQEQRHKKLEDRLESLTNAVETLLAERNNWKNTSFWLFFVVGFMFLVYCFNRYSAFKPATTVSTKPVEIQRRNSVDVVTRVSPKKKKRRPSDQALKIVASSASGDQEKQPRKRKKKSSNPSDSYCNDSEGMFSPPCTSSKIWTSKPLNSDWVEGRKVIEDIPFALDESDNSALETFPVPSEINTIEAPAYLKTATNARSGRSSLRNGKVKNINEIRRRQPSPVLSVNGSISSVNEQTPKKERRGFKKLFKKVF